MRVVSLTNHLQLEFEGNVMKSALCLGDIDNDGLNELVAGNDKGELAIFKGESSKPLFSAKGLGIITAVAVGDVLNVGRNIMIAITACGQCSFFDFDKESLEEFSKKGLLPFHTQRIPANVKVAYVGDINGDGFAELIVGLTDRVVRTYRWVSASEVVKVGKLIGLNKWEFAEQIGTITLHKSDDGTPCILVAQPSGTFFTLNVDSSTQDHPVGLCDEAINEFLTKLTLNLDPTSSSKLRSYEICGNIVNKFADESSAPSLAVATLDGILMLVKNGKILWKRTFDHELFAVNCVDLTRDGNEEVVACAWDGNTFVIKHNEESMQFAFPEAVNAFSAGMFGLKGANSPCLVYVTFNNRIFLYYDVSVPYMTPRTLIETLREHEEYLSLVESLGIGTNDVKLKKLNGALLYGFQ